MLENLSKLNKKNKEKKLFMKIKEISPNPLLENKDHGKFILCMG